MSVTIDKGRLGKGLEMTPMIDIVFQLLVFFIMTFKIVSQEGDFYFCYYLCVRFHGSGGENSEG